MQSKQVVIIRLGGLLPHRLQRLFQKPCHNCPYGGEGESIGKAGRRASILVRTNLFFEASMSDIFGTEIRDGSLNHDERFFLVVL